MQNSQFPIPQEVIDQYNRLYDLVQNKSKNGRVDVVDLAEYLGRTVVWVRNAIKNECFPYAYSDKSNRATFQIDVLPLFQYEMQNNIFRNLNGDGNP